VEGVNPRRQFVILWVLLFSFHLVKGFEPQILGFEGTVKYVVRESLPDPGRLFFHQFLMGLT
jgi:hypothetical protein